MKCYQLFFLLLFANAGFAQVTPGFKDVATTWFSKYSIPDDVTYPLFQKKKDGWYVVENSYREPGDYSNLQMFWSLKEKSYLPLNYATVEKDSVQTSSELNKYLSSIDWNFQEYDFERNKYYGYPGWDWDVMNDAEKGNIASDTLLESYARACTNYASGFMIEQYGNFFENDDPDRKPLRDTEAISQARINKFIQYEKKSIEAYKKLLAKNPRYQTRVGNIAIKYANEYMYLYSDLLMAGDEAGAKKALRGFSYPDSLLLLSKAILNAVDSNGIVFTGGDNDTYPLWFLQQTESYRKDVLVLNMNLLGLRRYVHMLDKEFKGTLFTTRSPVYLRNNFDYSYYKNENGLDTTIRAATFISKLNNQAIGENSDVGMVYKGEPLKNYNTKKLVFKNIGNDADTNSTGIKILLLNDYIMMSDFMILDIISFNFPKRKIFFTYPNELFSNFLEARTYVLKFDVGF